MKVNLDKIIAKFEENPVAFLAAGGMFLTGVGKIVSAAGNARGSNAYAKQVKYRIKNKK